MSTEINMARICKHWSTALQLHLFPWFLC